MPNSTTGFLPTIIFAQQAKKASTYKINEQTKKIQGQVNISKI